MLAFTVTVKISHTEKGVSLRCRSDRAIQTSKTSAFGGTYPGSCASSCASVDTASHVIVLRHSRMSCTIQGTPQGPSVTSSSSGSKSASTRRYSRVGNGVGTDHLHPCLYNSVCSSRERGDNYILLATLLLLCVVLLGWTLSNFLVSVQ